MLLARTEALDEVEAAAAQRFAAALPHERAELDKQVAAHASVRQCGQCCAAQAWFCGLWMRRLMADTAAGAMRVWQHGLRRSGAQLVS